MEQNICPRCSQDWFDDEGQHQYGTAIPSDCDECGVCENCEHLMECSKAN